MFGEGVDAVPIAGAIRYSGVAWSESEGHERRQFVPVHKVGRHPDMVRWCGRSARGAVCGEAHVALLGGWWRVAGKPAGRAVT